MQEDQHSLKSGTVLQNYTIIRVLGEGGFGITYLAKDNGLGLEVVIKEYFPNEFAMRTRENTITAKSKSVTDFTKGKQRFKEEAQTLAKFNHPSIVKILGYFEANDTAYFVMEYEEGIDLAQYLKQQNRALSQDEILEIIMPILEGLKEVHRYNYLHRDIKPGNILIRKNHAPVLIDFGATRVAVNNEQSKSVTSMLTEGYAPFEQYSTDMKRQGQYTDIYSIGAVMYKMITLHTPISSQTRAFQLLQDGDDPLKKLSHMKLIEYDSLFLKTIDRALENRPTDRPKNIQTFQKELTDSKRIEIKKKESSLEFVFDSKLIQDFIIKTAPFLVQNKVKKDGFVFLSNYIVRQKNTLTDYSFKYSPHYNKYFLLNEEGIPYIWYSEKDQGIFSKNKIKNIEQVSEEKSAIRKNTHLDIYEQISNLLDNEYTFLSKSIVRKKNTFEDYIVKIEGNNILLFRNKKHYKTYQLN